MQLLPNAKASIVAMPRPFKGADSGRFFRLFLLKCLPDSQSTSIHSNSRDASKPVNFVWKIAEFRDCVLTCESYHERDVSGRPDGLNFDAVPVPPAEETRHATRSIANEYCERARS
ncbi:MAG: hypothetical protein RIS70_3101 [Planctomycetota bacterium]